MKAQKLEASNLGTRITKARLDANLSVRQLANAVGITESYLRMIQRGERNPSATLLEKIAEATGSPDGWLGESLAVNPPSVDGTQKAAIHAPVLEPIDAALFLSLAVQSIPAMTPDVLANILTVSPDTMGSILTGGGYDAAQHWPDACFLLAMQMDIPVALRKVNGVASFLQHVAAEKKRRCYYAELKGLAGSEYQQPVPLAVSVMPSGTQDDGVYFEHAVLRKGASVENDWRFVLCLFDDDAEVDRYMVRDIMWNQISLAEGRGERLTLVFEDERVLELFQDTYGKLQAEKDNSMEPRPPMPPISLLLIDRDTGAVQGGLIELGNFDDNPDFM